MRQAADVEALTSWHHDWAGLTVAVLGSGRAGFSAADTLVELGSTVHVLAERADPERAELLDVIGARLRLTTIEDDAAEVIGDIAPDLAIVSPGIPPTHPLVAALAARGTPLWGDVELAWRLRDKIGAPAEWVCVTGTNGKTTTVQLATAMIAAAGTRVVACGNIGLPVLDAIRDPTGFDILVVELSSFQLHYTASLSPIASTCLNVSPDHLDWHGSAKRYAADKALVFERTKVACVYNRDDEATRTMVEDAEVVDGCRAIGFGLGVPGPSDFGIVDDILCDRAFLDERFSSALEIVTVDRLDAVGLGSPHMAANVLAASALARAVGTPLEHIRVAIDGFRLDHHRTETIARVDGVRYVDDSKATNPGAAQASLEAFDSVVWIAGGLLKGLDPTELVRSNAKRLRAAVLIGADRSALVAAFARHAPHVRVTEVDATDTDQVMPSALRSAAASAASGDVVLLAPAAASMDQFEDYADRGRRFAAAVHDMLGDRPDDDQPPSRPQNGPPA